LINNGTHNDISAMIKYDFLLKEYNTFGIAARTKRYIKLINPAQAKELLDREKFAPGNSLILGGGSNILFTKDFDGTVIQAVFDNIEINEITGDIAIVSAEAGLEWDRLVEWAVDNNLGGLENLSYIPGSVGAAPIQNIGAYGAEVSRLITAVHTLSLDKAEVRVFTNKECMFGYRNSIFKNQLKGKYLITKVDFMLKRAPHKFMLSYGNLENEIRSKGEITLAAIRDTVIKIRREKLPEPSDKGNAGSFFKNPVLSSNDYRSLKKKYRDIPSWPQEHGFHKIPAAWLIEKAGWKGKRMGKVAVHDKQPLVLVNLGDAGGKEILKLADMIAASVQEMFGITLNREVNIV